MRRRTFISFVASLAIASCAGSAFAAWPPDGVHLERPAPATSSGILDIGPDGQGGTFIAWPEADPSGALAFRIHRLTSEGVPPEGWTTTGVRAGSLPQWTGAPGVLPDGEGGVYLWWNNYSAPARVLRVGPDGAVSPGWPASGIAVASAPEQTDLVATDDGAGGVLLAWHRTTSGTTKEILTQRFLADGSRAAGFPVDGRPITFAVTGQTGHVRPRLVRDADRGFWVSYTTIGIDTTFYPSAYAVTHLDPSGLVTFGQQPNGLALSLPAGEVGWQPYVPVALALDGAGGTFTFTLGVNGIVRAFHVTISSEEDAAWPPGGLVLASGAGWPSVHFPFEERWPVAAGDLAGSAYVGWRKQSDFLLHGCRVDLDATIAPGWSGTPLVAGEMMSSFVADPGGLFAASLVPVGCPHFNCTGPLQIVRVEASGDVAEGWPGSDPPEKLAPGVILGYGGPNNISNIAVDGLGGVVIAWIEYPEYYAMRFVPPTGTVGVGPAVPAGAISVRARFDPAAGVRVSFALDRAGEGRLDLFDMAGRRLASDHVVGASGEITLAGTRRLPAGLCFVRLASQARHATARVPIVR